MRRELKWGFLNDVGGDRVGIMQVFEGSAKFSIHHGDPSGRDEYLKVAVGGLMEIDGSTWRLISVHRKGEVPEGSPPGTGAGKLAAVIEQEVVLAEGS